jgi:hypothetical protein
MSWVTSATTIGASGTTPGASETAISVVTALASVLSGVIAAGTLLLAGPRYRLRYGMKSTQTRPGLWWVGIWLASYGRRDITRKAFDDGQPIEFDISVDIRNQESTKSSQKSLRIVQSRVEGTRLLVGPGLIGRRQVLRFAVQAEAKPAGLTCQASLIDVSIRRQRLQPTVREAVTGLVWLFAVNYGAVVAVTVLQHHKVHINQQIVYGITIGASLVIFLWFYWRTRQT